MVPLRAIFEALGASVEWNQENQMVTSVKGDKRIILVINNPAMLVNGKSVALDTPACVIDDRTLVPVRAISEAFDLYVEWDNTARKVLISSKPFTNAFDALKNDIIRNGEYDYEYSNYVVVCPSELDGTFAMITYDPGDESISFFWSMDGNDFETTCFINICKDERAPGYVYANRNSYGEYECTAFYKNGSWSIYKSTFNQAGTSKIRESIDDSVELFDIYIYINMYSNVSLADFGIYY